MKSLKIVFTLTLCLQLFAVIVSAQETFDLTTFNAPKSWKKEVSPGGDMIRYTREDAVKNEFAMITIFKAVPAGTDPKANFDAAWEEFAKKTLSAQNPQMSPSKELNGWQIRSGLAAFQKEGISGVAMLATASAESKMANILLVTNTDIFKKEIDDFIASVAFKSIAVKSNVPRTTTAVQTPNRSKDKPEMWINRRIATSIYALPPILNDLYLIYPNGDYFPNVPYEGLMNVNRSFQPESWGRFTMQGTKGRFKNNYDEIAVTKRSETVMDKDGYNFSFYKFLPVDGLRIEGAYTHVSSDWGKKPALDYLSGPGCQFVVNFKKDGTFDDKGIFSTSRSNCSGGKGTYSIENFTITFKYDDGRVVYRLFSAPPTRNPVTYDETFYIGHTPHYKKNK